MTLAEYVANAIAALSALISFVAIWKAVVVDKKVEHERLEREKAADERDRERLGMERRAESREVERAVNVEARAGWPDDAVYVSDYSQVILALEATNTSKTQIGLTECGFLLPEMANPNGDPSSATGDPQERQKLVLKAGRLWLISMNDEREMTPLGKVEVRGGEELPCVLPNNSPPLTWRLDLHEVESTIRHLGYELIDWEDVYAYVRAAPRQDFSSNKPVQVFNGAMRSETRGRRRSESGRSSLKRGTIATHQLTPQMNLQSDLALQTRRRK